MMILYGLFFLMLTSAIGILATPYIKTQMLFSRGFLCSSAFVVFFALGLYQFSGNQAALKQWLAHGKQHYQLQEEVDRLGGIENIIAQIKNKLAAHPEDARGWLILGKLYLANQNYDEAVEALRKAQRLQPNDLQIKHFYELAIERRKQ